MKRDWVTIGVIELVGGTLAVLTGYAALRTGGFHILLVGWGFIFIIIGAIVLTVGVRDRNPNERFCLSCGRPIESGRMYCRKCNPR